MNFELISKWSWKTTLSGKSYREWVGKGSTDHLILTEIRLSWFVDPQCRVYVTADISGTRDSFIEIRNFFFGKKFLRRRKRKDSLECHNQLKIENTKLFASKNRLERCSKGVRLSSNRKTIRQNQSYESNAESLCCESFVSTITGLPVYKLYS